MKSLTSLTPNLDLVSEFIKPEYVPDLTTTVGKLKHLRHVVERIPPEQFKMDVLARQTDCGTVGCMLGWALFDPAFNAIGFRTTPETMYGSFFQAVWRDGVARGAGHYDQIGADVFGISQPDADDLFTSELHDEEDGPLTISHGLARIDLMIAKYSDL